MICHNCKNEIDDKAVICVKCGANTNKDDTDTISRILLPVGRSSKAIAAGYLGLFSVLIIPAPFSLLYGYLGYREIKNNPKKHGMGRAIFGIIMGALGTAVLLYFLFMILTNSRPETAPGPSGY